GTIVIGPGNTSGEIVLKVRGDTIDEIDERFKLHVWTNVSCNAEHRFATITILDDDVSNRAPTADPASATTPEDTAVNITLAGSDPDGDALTRSIVGGPAHGSITLAGSIATYTPAANYNGPDSFSFKVNDGSLDSSPATVSVTVTPVNDPPVAAADGPYQGQAG